MILVTGGSGFIGKYVVRKLLEMGRNVVVITRREDFYLKVGNELIVQGNLDNPDGLLTKIQNYVIDTCVHLAWEGIPDYSYNMSERNLKYGLSILKICKEKKIKNLIITGSCWEYRNPVGKVSVQNAIDCSNAFKGAKNSILTMAHVFCKENQIHLNWLRLFYVYGFGQKENSLIPYILQMLSKGKQLDLKGAYNENDFIYVDDVADAIARCVDNHHYPEVLNIGSGYATRVLDVARLVAEAYGVNINEEAYEKEQGISYFADMDETVRLFGWKANTSIEMGIKKTIDNYKKERNK